MLGDLPIDKVTYAVVEVPELELLKAPPPDSDFLDFGEADRLVAAAQGELRTMLLVALRTGMRHDELLALRWQDIDLVAGRITVRQDVVRGIIGTPKSGTPRGIGTPWRRGGSVDRKST